MSDPDGRAPKIAQVAATAWWGANSGTSDAIALGVVAALALTTRAGPDRADVTDLVMRPDHDGFADLLRRTWAMFAIMRPELCIRVGPFASWLEEPTSPHLHGAHATARAVVGAGLLDLTGDRELVRGVDLLGRVYQELRNPSAKKISGEIYTPTDVADAKVQILLDDPRRGQSICDPAAGTGGLLRAAAQLLRDRGIDPRKMGWYGADVDPVAVAGLAVNACLWDLGPHVVIGPADILTEPDWEHRAFTEQAQAIGDQHTRLLVARLLALTPNGH